MTAILDAGPLISLWNGDDQASWAEEIFGHYQGPFYTTEFVLAEIAYMTGRQADLAEMLRRGKLLAGATAWQDAHAIERCVRAFAHCDLADASIIVASEKFPQLPVLTCDVRHFATYRRIDGTPLPIVIPPKH